AYRPCHHRDGRRGRRRPPPDRQFGERAGSPAGNPGRARRARRRRLSRRASIARRRDAQGADGPSAQILSACAVRPWRGMAPAKGKGRTMAFRERVFSGVQPTGNLHLGNYLGAITKFVALQERFDCIYCVVDLHAITVWQDPSELPRATREVTAAFLACGIDPKKNIIFNQSQVAEHAELAWVFNCVARMGWLNRMTQFKEKAGKDRENASVGLYVYPNLMAADILVYRATHVPVGEDQKQHLELSRDIAQKFNNDFAESIKAHGYGDAFFPQPEPIIQGPATRVMSLRDGSKKMSKSEASDYSRINLTDDADAIAQKIRKAKTDPEPLPSEVKGLEPRPEADNLVGI